MFWARIILHKYDTKIGTCTYPAYTTKVVFFVPGFEKWGLYRPKYLFTASTRLLTCSFS